MGKPPCWARCIESCISTAKNGVSLSALRFCCRDGVRTASQGEADFVVLHPRHGILAIEVKAGGIAYEDGAWKQTNRRTDERKVIYPFQQAENSCQRILAELRQRMPQHVPIVGKAVWLTSVEIPQGKPLPLESPRDIILDAGDLREPKAKLEKIYSYWRKLFRIPERVQSLSVFKQVIQILQPVFRIVETVSAASQAVEQSTARLTNAQFALLYYAISRCFFRMNLMILCGSIRTSSSMRHRTSRAHCSNILRSWLSFMTKRSIYFMIAGRQSFRAARQGRRSRWRQSGSTHTWTAGSFSIATAAIRRRLGARCRASLRADTRIISMPSMAKSLVPYSFPMQNRLQQPPPISCAV